MSEWAVHKLEISRDSIKFAAEHLREVGMLNLVRQLDDVLEDIDSELLCEEEEE